MIFELHKDLLLLLCNPEFSLRYFLWFVVMFIVSIFWGEGCEHWGLLDFNLADVLILYLYVCVCVYIYIYTHIHIIAI